MDRVVVLMSTYNGEDYLREQLDSLLEQRGVELLVLIRDDGSTDSTRDILRHYAGKYRNIHLSFGKNKGAAKSFWKLLLDAGIADYYAFCDQDDIWMPEKLERAIGKLHGTEEYPALYYSSVTLVDADGNVIPDKESVYQRATPTFAQLIVENNAVGCTMVWNRKLQNIAKQLKPEYMRMHDHMLYLICQACTGFVYHDRKSYIHYRQHERNVIGGRNTVSKYLGSIHKYIKEDSGLVRQALQLKKLDSKYVCNENKAILKIFETYKRGKYFDRVRLTRMSCYEQESVVKNILIRGMIWLGRL